MCYNNNEHGSKGIREILLEDWDVASKLKDMPQGAAILTVNNHHFQHFTCPMNLGQQEKL